MTFDRKKFGQKLHDEKLDRYRKITDRSDANASEKKYAMQKKNAMGIFGALLLQAPAGRTYKLKLQNPKWTAKQLNAWLKIANAECGTEASIVTDADGNIPRRDGCIFVAL